MFGKTFLLTLINVALVFGGTAECGLIRVVDQANDPPAPFSVGSIRFADQSIVQEFRPALSGLDAVELRMIDRGVDDTDGAQVFVRIRWFGLTGPIVGTSDLLSLPDQFGVATDGGIVTLTFPKRLMLTPDEPYFIEVNQLRGDNFHVGYTGLFDYYDRGHMWAGYPTPMPQETDDLWFRTGLVPEPSGLTLAVSSLFLLGAATLFAAARRLLGSCGGWSDNANARGLRVPT
jgi:hypothetical protein